MVVINLLDLAQECADENRLEKKPVKRRSQNDNFVQTNDKKEPGIVGKPPARDRGKANATQPMTLFQTGFSRERIA